MASKYYSRWFYGAHAVKFIGSEPSPANRLAG